MAGVPHGGDGFAPDQTMRTPRLDCLGLCAQAYRDPSGCRFRFMADHAVKNRMSTSHHTWLYSKRAAAGGIPGPAGTVVVRAAAGPCISPLLGPPIPSLCFTSSEMRRADKNADGQSA